MNDERAQLVVIGGGPGGYAAAFMAADLGLDVALIDPERNPGGVCLYRGCIPSKALLHAAKLITDAGEADSFGIEFERPRIRVDKLRAWKNEVVGKLTGGLGQLASQRKIRFLQGTAGFQDAHTLQIEEDGGGKRRLGFENAIVATGSRPVALPGVDPASARFMDSARALELETVPDKLLVVGGGYIGLEIGTVYAALGASVTVVEMTGGLLPGVDRDLVRILKQRLEKTVSEILLDTKVTGFKEQKNGVMTTLKTPDGSRKRLFDRVLVAVGRRPNSEGLGLEKIGVRVDEQGFIRVDGQQRTDVPSVFAIGDAAGEPMLAHKASHEGRIAAEVVSGRDVARDEAAIPAVVFTDPEIAWAGLTETEARDRKIDYRAARFPWAASGRALTLGRTDGVTKVLVDPGSERVLGVGIVGSGAGELIAEAVAAIEMGASAGDLGLTIHPHPTLSETLKEAAELFHGTATHVYRKKKR
jgi:dihydrolipoamide dehydrogenase